MSTRSSLLGKFWNSSIRLACISCFLLLISISLNLFRTYLERSEKIDHGIDVSDVDDVGNFDTDMDYVLETIQYMHDLKRGSAEIRPVVEKEKDINQYWWQCHLMMPKVVFANTWFENDGFSVYSATYDRRHSSLYPKNHIVQVLAMSFRSISQKQKVFCNLYDMVHERYVVVEGKIREIWQRAWDPRDFFYIPNLISCPVPQFFKYSSNLTVSVSKKACKSQNSAAQVRITLPSGKEKLGIAVCVKGLDYVEDIAERLVEWIEMQFITGADTITVYTYFVPHKMKRVLDFYMDHGSITVIPLDLPAKSPSQIFVRNRFIWRNRQQKRRHELIPYNDCLYRHIDSHKYVLILDIDEVVVPLKHDNWNTMLNHVVTAFRQRNWNTPEITSISIRNVFKFPSNVSVNATVPFYMEMLRNRGRSEIISKPGEFGKSFINTNVASTVFNHFALHRQHGDAARTVYVDPNIALKLHYKAKCPAESEIHCELLEQLTVNDASLERFADQLTERVTKVLKILHVVD